MHIDHTHKVELIKTPWYGGCTTSVPSEYFIIIYILYVKLPKRLFFYHHLQLN